MRRLLLAALVFSSGCVVADELTPCASIDDNVARLRCYDAASGRMARLAAVERSVQGTSIWERRIVDDAARQTFTLTSYRPTYLMYTYMSSPNDAAFASIDPGLDLENEEIKLQFSLQTKAVDDLFGRNGDLWVAYSQSAYWQLFSEEISSPFRETDHEPEAFLAFLTDYRLFGLTGRSVNFGLVHQSNGQASDLSRSWNRVFAEFQFVGGGWSVSLKPWVRLSEDASEDDNPDIEDYLGNYELRTSYERGRHLYRLMLRNVFDSEHRYNAELSWSFPISNRLRGLVQWYSGYGESLIDYNHKNSRISVGVLMSDWL